MQKRTLDALEALRRLLVRRGLVTASDLLPELKLSQATFSRLTRSLPHIIKLGQTKRACYALARPVPELPAEIPIYAIDTKGQSHLQGNLYPIEPAPRFAYDGDQAPRSFESLPYFLETQRVAGFLGRLVRPPRIQGAAAPARLEDWSEEAHLHFLHYAGWDRPGNLILGNVSLDEFRLRQSRGIMSTPESERARIYPDIVKNIAEKGNVGSSAGGEQPKFAVTLSTASHHLRFLIVKYSPPLSSTEGRRVRDLIVAEHVALEILRNAGVSASRTSLFSSPEHEFLEVERFDRLGEWGRRGYLSIGALNAELGGARATWPEMGLALHKHSIISLETLNQIRRIESFGQLIANTDRHMGNLSFFFDDMKAHELTPVYDMLPMAYMPRNGQIFTPAPNFAPPLAGMEDAWLWAYPVACSFWDSLAGDSRLSEEFRLISRHALDSLQRLRKTLILKEPS